MVLTMTLAALEGMFVLSETFFISFALFISFPRFFLCHNTKAQERYTHSGKRPRST